MAFVRILSVFFSSGIHNHLQYSFHVASIQTLNKGA